MESFQSGGKHYYYGKDYFLLIIVLPFLTICDKIPDRSNLKEDRFSWTYSSGGHSPSWQERHVVEAARGCNVRQLATDATHREEKRAKAGSQVRL